MDLSTDLPNDTVQDFLAHLSDNNFAEIAISELEKTPQDFIQAFPEIDADFQACISKLSYLAEIDEQITSDIAARIKTSLSRAQKAWNALSSLEVNDQETGLVQLREQTLLNLAEGEKDGQKKSYQDYQHLLIASLTGVNVDSAARGDTGGAYVMNSRQAKTFARNQLGIIAAFADLLQVSLVTLGHLEDEDEIFLITGASAAIESQLQERSLARSRSRVIDEFGELGENWISMFSSIQQDFFDCISMLNQLEDSRLFDDLQTELYSSLLQAEEAWQDILLVSLPAQDSFAAGSLKSFGQALISEIKQCYQSTALEIPIQVQSSIQEHLDALVRCANLLAETRLLLTVQSGEHQNEE